MGDPVWETKIDECKEIFTKKLNLLNPIWDVGVMNWAKEHEPQLYFNADELDGQMDDLWLNYAAGQSDLSYVKDRIDLWYHAQLALLTKYKRAHEKKV